VCRLTSIVVILRAVVFLRTVPITPAVAHRTGENRTKSVGGAAGSSARAATPKATAKPPARGGPQLLARYLLGGPTCDGQCYKCEISCQNRRQNAACRHMPMVIDHNRVWCSLRLATHMGAHRSICRTKLRGNRLTLGGVGGSPGRFVMDLTTSAGTIPFGTFASPFLILS